jgi:predicted O-methyltransferase YrrM
MTEPLGKGQIPTASLLGLLRTEQPKFHGTELGPQTITWGLEESVLEFLLSRLPAGGTTLETGSGLSTVVFVSKSDRHIAIAPDAEERGAIVEFCKGVGLDSGGFEFHAGRSQDVLPSLQLPALDAVLIDGDHAFPAPFLDWYYTADALRAGGLLLVDDVQLHTGHVLRQFLRDEPEWRHVRDIGKTSVFEKLTDARVTDKWWGQQPWAARKHALRGDNLKTRIDVLRVHLRVRTRMRQVVERLR